MSDSKVSRRAILEAAGALATGAGAYELGSHRQAPKDHGASSSYAREVMPAKGSYKSALVVPRAVNLAKPHLELVCHGMMLFHYIPDKDPDSLYILLPNPIMNGTQVHQISMTFYYGLVQNLLLDSSGSLQQGGYQLSFNPAADGKPYTQANSLYPGPLAKEEVVLHDPSDTPQHPVLTNRIVPNTDTWNLWNRYRPPTTSDPIWFSVKVPFPTQVYQYSMYSFTPPAYRQTDNTATTFLVNPSSLAGIHVLFWEDIDPKTLSLLYYQDPRKPGVPVTTPAAGNLLTKVQLYCQPAVVPPKIDPAHLDLFDLMVGYGNQKRLDLGYPATKTTPFSNQSAQDIDADLTPMDMADLSSLTGTTGVVGFTTDPVECLQGWGT